MSKSKQNRDRKATASAALACAVACAPVATSHARTSASLEPVEEAMVMALATIVAQEETPAEARERLYPSLSMFTQLTQGTEPVQRNPYNPWLDVACDICKVPYGEVGVGGAPEFVRSHEVHLMDRDPSGFIPKKEARLDRNADRGIFDGWEESYAARLVDDEAHRAASAVCSCPACVAVRTSEGAALRDAWNEFAEAHMADKPFLQILLAGFGSEADLDDRDDLTDLTTKDAG